MNPDIKIIHSKGRGRLGKMYAYVRPSRTDIFQNSRRVGGFTQYELKLAIDQVIAKWYSPMKYFIVDGHLLGSNSSKNALKEYWRVCDKEKIKIPFEVKEAEL